MPTCRLTLFIAVLAPALWCGCATPSHPDPSSTVNQYRADSAAARVDLAEERALLLRSFQTGELTKKIPVEGGGELCITHLDLVGAPGHEAVSARFIYTNNSADAVQAVLVTAALADASGRIVSTQQVWLRMPMSAWMEPGTDYSDVVRLPTRGHHRAPSGWSWSLRGLAHRSSLEQDATLAKIEKLRGASASL